MRVTRLFAAFATVCLAACSSDSAIDGVPEGTGPVVPSSSEEEVLAPPPGVDRTTARVEAAVLAQLAADEVINATEFEVGFAAGVVTITSTTESAEAWSRARALAALVAGVTSVEMASAMPEGEVGELPVSPHQIEEAFALATHFGTPPDDPESLVLEVSDGSGEGDGIAEAASGDRPRTYVVGPGDSLSIIAQRTMGDGLAWPQLYEFNRNVIGPDPGALRQGMELRIPQD